MSTRLDRFLLRLLSRRSGQARAAQRLRQLQDVLRFALLFIITILVPAALLAYLALSSIRSEELGIDADLRSRADTIVRRISAEHAAIFERFEVATSDRLLRGESPLSNLAELSPYLRAAFRFDAAGNLAAPFERGRYERPPEPPPLYERVLREALRLEGEGNHAGAFALYTRAAEVVPHPVHQAEARLAAARALYRGGHERDAERALADLYADHAHLRDSRGHGFGDLAILKRAEMRYAREPDVGAPALQELVEQLLASHWTIDSAGEPAIARRALALLEQTADPDWLARTRSRLNERTDHLYWATLVEDDLEFVHLRAHDDDFLYTGARAGAPALWATVRHDDVYAFSFSVRGLFQDLLAIAARTDDLETDLVVELLGPDEVAGPHVLATGTLAPQLPIVTIAVRHADLKGLEALKAQKSRVKLIIVATALSVVIFGVALSARMIGREVEGARMKADFAANVSHELRSPITQIRLKGEALQLGLVEPGDDMDQHFAAIVNEAERLSRLVDNVLDFAAIERGAKRYHLRRDDLGLVVETAIEAARTAIEQRGLQLEVDIADDLPPVWVDREAIKQVLINLLSNAAKYGADGGWVGVCVRQGLDGVDVDVSDRGIGIREDDLRNVFDDFFRSTEPRVRSKKGTGIGLSIVRYIVEAHGGSVSVDSYPGQGATFTVTLPLDPPPDAEVQA